MHWPLITTIRSDSTCEPPWHDYTPWIEHSVDMNMAFQNKLTQQNLPLNNYIQMTLKRWHNTLQNSNQRYNTTANCQEQNADLTIISAERCFGYNAHPCENYICV